MKLWLDDERPEPEGWVRAKTSQEAIQVLEENAGKIEALSLDHDLGGEDTGYLVVTWLEEQVILHGLIPPQEMSVHSANPVGRARMVQAISSIRAYQKKAAPVS